MPASQTSIAASGPIYKAFGKGNRINNIPAGLEAFSPYLSNTQEASNVKWLKWQVDGKKFLEIADQCPYCSGSIEHAKAKILQITEEYDSKAIEHLDKMLVLFGQLSPYFSEATREQIALITNNAGNMTTQQKRYLFEIKDQVNSVLVLLQGIKKLLSLHLNLKQRALLRFALFSMTKRIVEQTNMNRNGMAFGDSIM